jgi:hypothetical protein
MIFGAEGDLTLEFAGIFEGKLQKDISTHAIALRKL